MLVVAMASQKGGSGKTTLAGHLAVEAEKAGAGPVALIDTDPQGSLSQWWNARAATTPQFAKVGVFDLASALNHLQRLGLRLAIVDTPPAITESIAEVIAQSDLVVVPTRPSPHDLRAVGATADMAERCGKPLIFVVNAGTLRARITGEAAVALSQHGTVAPVTIHNRIDFAASMVDGRTVGEAAPKSPSAKEISDLWIYVQDRLARLTGTPALTPSSKPQYFSVSALSGMDDDAILPPSELPPPEDSVVALLHPQPPPQRVTPSFAGMERRASAERRERGPDAPLFGGEERRSGSFGRRHTDLK